MTGEMLSLYSLFTSVIHWRDQCILYVIAIHPAPACMEPHTVALFQNELTVCLNCRGNLFLMVPVQGIEVQSDYINYPQSCTLKGYCEWKVQRLWSRHFILLPVGLILSEKERQGKGGEMETQRTDKRRTRFRKWDYLEEEDDVPDESQDDGGVSISNIRCVDTDQLHLRTHVNM